MPVSSPSNLARHPPRPPYGVRAYYTAVPTGRLVTNHRRPYGTAANPPRSAFAERANYTASPPGRLEPSNRNPTHHPNFTGRTNNGCGRPPLAPSGPAVGGRGINDDCPSPLRRLGVFASLRKTQAASGLAELGAPPSRASPLAAVAARCRPCRLF